MNRFVQSRLRKQSRLRVTQAHENALCAIRDRLLSNLSESYVQESLDRLWNERAQYRTVFGVWRRLGGASVVSRIGRLYEIARPGTIREKKWLLDAISSLHWVNPPIEIINDSIHYDIHIKVRSLRNTHGRGGQNPYEWVREDKMSVSDGESINAARAHVKQVERASYSSLTKWLESSMKRLVTTDEALSKIEDRLHRAYASAHAYAETPDGRWMGLGFEQSYPFTTPEKLEEFRVREAKANSDKRYPS